MDKNMDINYSIDNTCHINNFEVSNHLDDNAKAFYEKLMWINILIVLTGSYFGQGEGFVQKYFD